MKKEGPHERARLNKEITFLSSASIKEPQLCSRRLWAPLGWQWGRSDMVLASDINQRGGFQESSFPGTDSAGTHFLPFLSPLCALVTVTKPRTAGAVSWAQEREPPSKPARAGRQEPTGHRRPHGTITQVPACRPRNFLLCEGSNLPCA